MEICGAHREPVTDVFSYSRRLVLRRPIEITALIGHKAIMW
jgi:hypothetical protein